jgi:lipopolysaccharide transport system permease protein
VDPELKAIEGPSASAPKAAVGGGAPVGPPEQSSAVVAPPGMTVIRPRPAWRLIDWHELRHYRDLFYFLVLREIQVRYKQTVLGGLWAVLQPFLTMIVFTLFFGRLAGIPSDGVPHPVFYFAAVVPWTYFSNALGFAGNSLVNNQDFISKVYFPRIAIPLAPIIGWLLDFGIALIMLFGMMAVYGLAPTPHAVLLPLLTLLMVFTAAGVGMWLAALNVQYRDFRYVVPFLVQIWMFVSPVVYPMSMIPERFRLIYALNPMVGIIEGFRSALLGTTAFPWSVAGVSTGVSILMLIGGLAYFRKVERVFADVA